MLGVPRSGRSARGRVEGGTHERIGEARIAAAARCVRLELAWPPSHVDRAADRCVPLAVQGGDLLRIALCSEQPRAGRVARRDVDVEHGSEVAELREPEAVLVDEVEREEVAAGGD